ncbi:DUF2867 domain-containing protein [Nocardioides sp. zg-DK7169]|uniref:DUF2867 domain-containing protein n=1 Tax=Nocardioides sp. zg-DK7169 TaxID=2736600 RepID=UPI001557804F|nr:DUF2867 domain-containing protein [Nocardioides sp. zg-DK7169]NPC98141.1 DUF2867 domain-containing protein [Nocardioides sp. zg-DK7169]
MRLPAATHHDQSWVIHAVTPDFEVEDVWSLRAQDPRADFASLVEAFVDDDFPDSAPRAVRLLWHARWVIGQALRWDRPDDGLGERVTSLRERLPAELRHAPPRHGLDGVPFSTLYETDEEWALELANRTVHAVLHLGWVPDGEGGGRGQMAVLVRPNGLLGRGYLAAIKPLRHRIVYPALLRGLERRWLAASARRADERSAT